MAGEEAGFFSYYLEEGLKGAAADEKGNITLISLEQYLEKNVPEAVNRHLGKEYDQTPYFKREGTRIDQWVLARAQGGDLQGPIDDRRRELDRLKEMESAAEAARREEDAEMARLDAQIAGLKGRLGTAAPTGTELDAMVAMVRKKEAEQKRLEDLRRKKAEEERRRQAEIEALKRERGERIIAAIRERVKKYETIVSSEFGKEIKSAAWQGVIAGYETWAEGDVENLLRRPAGRFEITKEMRNKVYKSLSEALVEPEQVFQLDLGRKNLRAYRRRSAN